MSLDIFSPTLSVVPKGLEGKNDFIIWIKLGR